MYAYARLDRTGLGNMLFPWARAEVFCRQHGCPALAPAWTKVVRLGPWIRGEKDKRLYWQVFSSGGYVSGLRKQAILLTSKRVLESEAAANKDIESHATNCVVEFRGMEHHFTPFASEGIFIRDRLTQVAQPWVSKTVQAEWPAERRFIAVHIRRGDFQPWHPRRAGESVMQMQLPIAWYELAIRRAKEMIGDDVETLVFTDDREHGLEAILGNRNTQLATDAPALCHMLALANAAAIVGSASTFSWWAAFLSTAPAIWFPGFYPPPRFAGALNIQDAFGLDAYSGPQ
jgi:hypothetical protein